MNIEAKYEFTYIKEAIMIQFGMRVHDLCPKGPLLTVLDSIHDADIKHVQLAFGKSVSDYNFSTGHYSAGFGNYIRREAAREAAVDRFIEHLKYAKRIGADMVGTETGRFSTDFKVTPLTKTEECYQTILKSFRRIVRAAEQLGVTVGVEGVFDHTLHSPEMMARFLNDIDSEAVEIILDAVNLMTPDVEFDADGQAAIIDKAFELYGNRISVLHLKDFVFDGEKQLYRHPGEGHFHYEALMRHIREKKPHIIGLLENSSPDRFVEDCAYLEAAFNKG